MSIAGVRRCGERAVVLDTDSDPASLAAAVVGTSEPKSVELVDVVPGAASVLVIAANPVQLQEFLRLLPTVAQAAAADSSEVAGEVVELAVRYDGPDLAAVAQACELSVAELVRRHSSVTYHAAFTGFTPGFAYLVGLDERLRLTRRSSPRPAVPAGSVAIADVYTAVYPRATPGGWHLLGTTDAVMFDPGRSSPALLRPGTTVRFNVARGPLP